MTTGCAPDLLTRYLRDGSVGIRDDEASQLIADGFWDADTSCPIVAEDNPWLAGVVFVDLVDGQVVGQDPSAVDSRLAGGFSHTFGTPGAVWPLTGRFAVSVPDVPDVRVSLYRVGEPLDDDQWLTVEFYARGIEGRSLEEVAAAFRALAAAGWSMQREDPLVLLNAPTDC